MHKNGVEDLKKSIWYINDEIKKLSTDTVDKPGDNTK
jgi:hypothetical protein